MSAALVGLLFLILTVTYVFLRGSTPENPQYRRQVLRRRAWYREERLRRATDSETERSLDLLTWHNPRLIISRIVELPVGMSFEFENDPPLLQRTYTGEALLRIKEPNETTVVAEIMEPKPSKDNPILRVLVRGADASVADPGDSFCFLENSKLR